jgi:LTXXQ motif family protein
MTKINKKTIARNAWKPRNARKPRSAALKIAASAGVISLMLAAAAGAALAAKPGGGGGGGHPGGGGGGGHPGGGGAPHMGGGAPHFGGGGGGAPHFSAPHFSGGRPGGGGGPHFTAHAVPRFNAAHAHFAPNFASHTHGGASGRFAHTNHGIASHANLSRTNASHTLLAPSAAHSLATTAHPLAAAHNLPAARQAAFHADPRAFAAHRQQFATNAAFRPFWHHGWHPWHHLGWIGPVFWPYAYGDFFYYALWPDDYYDVDPFWAYGYGDIYSAMFSPYDYSDYVQGPRAPERMATLTQNMAQSCSDEAAEVTGWPVDQIQAAVQPTQQQSALLDDLGNALVKASDEVKSHCPTAVAFTPTARLDDMQQRLQALAEAVNIVSPPLGRFYDSLSDEQKARFNNIAPPEGKQESARQNQAAPNPQAQCSASVMNWPGDQIDRVVRPDDAQRSKLQALQSASAQASDIIKAACPSDVPATPPARLAAVGQRLNAMLQAVSAVRPALADFYGSLSDDQKARFNTMGKQLFAENSH